MRQTALEFYHQGYNCSQCILKSAEKKYGFVLSEQELKLCTGISGGFGIGGMCSAIVAGIMLLGIFFEEEKVDILRLEMMNTFQKRYSSLNCSNLKRLTGEYYCEDFILEAADIIDEIIMREMNQSFSGES